MLIVEALEHFCTLPNAVHISDPGSRASEASQAALVCAALLDGAAVCARRSKSQAHLIVSFNQDLMPNKLCPLIDIFFTDVVWLFKKAKADDSTEGASEYCMTNLETAGSQVRQYSIFFKPQSDCGAVVINKVSFWENFDRNLTCI